MAAAAGAAVSSGPGLLSWITGSFANGAIAASLRPLPAAADAAALAAREAELVIHDVQAEAEAEAGEAGEAGPGAFERRWAEERAAAAAAAPPRAPSLRRALWRAFRGQFLFAAALKAAWGALVLAGVAYFVRTLLNYIRFRSADPEHTPEEAAVGIGHAVGFLLCMLLQSLAMQQMSVVSARLGLRVHTAVAAAVYRKSLAYDRFASDKPAFDVVGLVSKDCAKLGEACTTLQYLWSGALEAAAIMGVLIGFVGRAALPGVGVVLLLVPAQFAVGVATARARKRAVSAADTRVRLTDEVLRAIKLVKVYAWEKKFAAGVAAERLREDAIASDGGILKAINYALVFVMPPIIALGIFGVQTLDARLDAGLAFTTLSLFNTLRLPLVLLPKGLRAAVEAGSSAERICEFLLAPERKDAGGGAAAASAAAPSDAAAASASLEAVVVAGAGGEKAATAAAASLPLTHSGKFACERGAVEMAGASFAYGARGATLLRGVSLQLAPGSITAITGAVGSGKSSLLSAVLGHMECTSGRSAAGGSFAYVPQTPWCAHGTVRDNITFGKPWDEARYRSVLFACALERDMGLMADGDLTEIGERGMNLSGGQRQRIAVARAVYARSDIVLLDSPLSAVDAYTSQHIFRHAILGLLRAEGATVLLVTHAVELLPEADTLIVMHGGAAAFVGEPTPAALAALFPAADAAEHVDEVLLSALSDSPKAKPAKPAKPAAAKASKIDGDGDADDSDDANGVDDSDELFELGAARNKPRSLPSSEGATLQRGLSLRGKTLRTLAAAADGELAAGPAAADGKGTARKLSPVASRSHLLTSTSTAAATAATIRSVASASAEFPLALPGSPAYEALMAKRIAARLGAAARAAGGDGVGAAGNGGVVTNSYLVLLYELRVYIFVPVVLTFVAAQLVRIYSDIWVSVWASHSAGASGEAYYLGVYGGYVAVFAVLLYLRGIFFYKAFVAAATRLHDKMFAALLRAPMAFFTLTPLGGVLSTVSRDMDLITEYLLEDAYMVIVYIMVLGTTIGVVVRQVPVFAAVAAVLLVLSGLIFLRFLAASRVLKARAGAAATAVASHVAETVQGLAVVQAFRAEARYARLNDAKLREMLTANFTLAALNLWLAVREDLVGCLLVFATCIMCVALEVRLSPAAAGLAVSNSFQILLFLSLMVRTAASAHDAMGAVDRVHRLGELAPEPDLPAAQAPQLAAHWPSQGEVEFRNVVMSYVPSAPHVLKGVSFHVRAGEKIGIVGRTGAGKSSLIMALFRLAPPNAGAVRIDGVDVSKLALHDLRSRVAIIPQEPVMFEGTLRSNLDPFGERTDETLLAALDKCLLRETVQAHKDGLLQPVESMGANFSLGQQQLVCLARALLNESKLLLLDEATAALDAETDAMVQRVVRSAFADRTVMTIAHRLDTIIDSDRILVMDAGRVAEFAAPAELLRDEGTIFASLCRQAGASNFAGLKATAEKHAEVLQRISDAAGLAEEDRIQTRSSGIVSAGRRGRLGTTSSVEA